MSSFEQRREIVRGESSTLKLFLMSRLQPWRWPIMLANGGIRVERGGFPVQGLTLDYVLSAGEVVVIDDAFGSTYMELRRTATRDYRDLAFCPKRTRENGRPDMYLILQMEALRLDPRVQEVPLGVPHLYALVERLTALADHPIRHLIFASHASPFGEIMVPMRDGKGTNENPDYNAPAITIESLNEAIAGKALRLDGRGPHPLVLPRPENAQGLRMPCAIIIRGCSAGQHTRLLARIQEAFGYMVDTVVMPKFLNAADVQGRVSPTQYAALVEYFQHEHTVTSKTPLTRDEVIAEFRKARLTDWLGRPVPALEWDAWVGPDAITEGAPTARISARVAGRDRPVTLRAQYSGSPMISKTWVMTQDTQPTEDEMRSFMLERWIALPSFQDPEWPYWERMGIRSLAGFSLYWHYGLDADAQKKLPKGQWAIEGRRYVYIVRTPLLEDGTLVAHYHPAGEKGNETNLIDYNDDRIFGRYANIPKHFAQKL